MTRFTCVLSCGCIVFPENGSDFDIELALWARGGRDDPPAAVCFFHRVQTAHCAVVNGGRARLVLKELP